MQIIESLTELTAEQMGSQQNCPELDLDLVRFAYAGVINARIEKRKKIDLTTFGFPGADDVVERLCDLQCVPDLLLP
ncbi:MAG TPA: hypothetical protein V6D17_05715 [Candidatus Obscuribacterales bacterium]